LGRPANPEAGAGSMPKASLRD